MIRNATLVLIFFAFQACNLNQTADNKVIIDVDDDFKIGFRENLETQEDDLIFFLESIDNRECEADTLLMEVVNFNTALRLNIDVVNTSGACMPGLRPATTEVASSNIRKGQTALSIQLENLVDNQGDIILDDQGYTIQMETTYGFYLPYDRVLKVPRSSIWGYIGFRPNLSQVAQQFLEEFYALSDDVEVAEGQYGYFTVGKNQALSVEGQQELAMFTQPFLRTFQQADKRTIRTLFEDYQEKYPGLKLVFLDSFGDVFE